MAGVIKASQLSNGPAQAHPAAFSFADMNQQADRYLQEVRSQAAQIIAEAKTAAETIRKQAEVDGREAAKKAAQAGLQATETALRQRLDQQAKLVIPALEKAAAQVVSSHQDWRAECERNLGMLAVRIAEKVVRREVRQSPEITVDLAREAIELASSSRKTLVCLHPEDHAALGENVLRAADALGRMGQVEITADAAVERGGCRVLTEYGVIDQQLSTRLKRIEEELV